MQEMKGEQLHKENGGFSLVELLIAIAILGVIGIGIGSFMLSGINMFGNGQATADMQAEGQLFTNRLTDLMQSMQRNMCVLTESGSRTTEAPGGSAASSAMDMGEADSVTSFQGSPYTSEISSSLATAGIVEVIVIENSNQTYYLAWNGYTDGVIEGPGNGTVYYLVKERDGRREKGTGLSEKDPYVPEKVIFDGEEGNVSSWAPLATHVSSLKVTDLSKTKENRRVTGSFGLTVKGQLAADTKRYTNAFTVMIRNAFWSADEEIK